MLVLIMKYFATVMLRVCFFQELPDTILQYQTHLNCHE